MTDLTINLNSMIIKTKMMHLRWQEGSAIIIKIKSHINNDLKLIRYRKSVIKLLWNRIGLNLKAIILCVNQLFWHILPSNKNAKVKEYFLQMKVGKQQIYLHLCQWHVAFKSTGNWLKRQMKLKLPKGPNEEITTFKD